MADKTTTTFPKMGTTAASTVVNQSAAPSPHTKPVRKRNSKGGSVPDAGTATHRTGGLERLGFKGAPQARIVYPNNPVEAGQLFRNVRLMQSSIGNRDFYLKRQYGQVQQ